MPAGGLNHKRGSGATSRTHPAELQCEVHLPFLLANLQVHWLAFEQFHVVDLCPKLTVQGFTSGSSNEDLRTCPLMSAKDDQTTGIDDEKCSDVYSLVSVRLLNQLPIRCDASSRLHRISGSYRRPINPSDMWHQVELTALLCCAYLANHPLSAPPVAAVMP